MSGIPRVVCVTVSATMSGLCPSTYLLQPVVSLNACIGYNNVAILCVKCNTTSVVFPIVLRGIQKHFFALVCAFSSNLSLSIFGWLGGITADLYNVYTCVHIYPYIHMYAYTYLFT